MDWQNDEFEGLLRKFRLRDARPLTVAQPVVNRGYRVKIAAAAVLALAIGASAAMVRQLAVKEDVSVVAQSPREAALSAIVEEPRAGAVAVVSVPIPPLPRPATPVGKLDPKVPDPLKQLTVVVPAPAQDAGPMSKQDPPQPLGTEEDKGHKAFLAACGSCHSVTAAESSHFDTPQEYAAIVDRMVSIGAAVAPQEYGAIVDYLFKTYGGKKN